MGASSRSRCYAFDLPAAYRIRVQGRIAEERAERIGGMKISVIIPEGGQPVTTLTSELRDQAALIGVLNTLYEWHLPVLSVERFTAGPF